LLLTATLHAGQVMSAAPAARQQPQEEVIPDDLFDDSERNAAQHRGG
jgi:hypothetical protein